ncbi:hypothetical protein, partial [Enterobacter hormaechei]
PERPKGADCKSAVTDFEGSNPSPTTTFWQRQRRRSWLEKLTSSNRKERNLFFCYRKNWVAEFQDAGIV